MRHLNCLCFILLISSAWFCGCSEDVEETSASNNDPAPACEVLRALQSRRGAEIAGPPHLGSLADYTISVAGEVTPLESSACQEELAKRLEGLCMLCEQSIACEQAAESLFERDGGTFPIACALCGDGVCTAGENPHVGSPGYCAEDCARVCGDAICQAGETPDSCPEDCAAANPCGDGVCDALETPDSCPGDCGERCGNGQCRGGEQRTNPDAPHYCPEDCCNGITCGDGLCSESCEDVDSCAADCQLCGDNICSNTAAGGTESLNSCPRDCSVCGDGICSRNEVIVNPDAAQGQQLCLADCCDSQSICGDGLCNIACETADTCATDCQ